MSPMSANGAADAEHVQASVAEQRAADDACWAALMLRAQDGDTVAYHQLLQEIAPYVRAIARRYLGRGEDAEDGVQEVLLVVHGIRHTFERGRPFKPWLGTIAARRCMTCCVAARIGPRTNGAIRRTSTSMRTLALDPRTPWRENRTRTACTARWPACHRASVTPSPCCACRNYRSTKPLTTASKASARSRSPATAP